MRKKTRLALIGAALAVAGSGISVSLAGTAHATSPTVSITQTQPYSNGQSLTLTGSNFPFGAANPTGLQILECSDPGGLPGNLPTDASLGCDGTTLTDISDPGGNVNAHFSVSLLQSATGLSNINCTSTQYCALWVGEDSSNLSNNSAFTAPFLLNPTTPTITPQTFPTGHIGLPIHFRVQSAGDPIPAVSAPPADLPPGVSFTDNGDGSASLNGTPTAVGSYVIPVTASSTAGTATHSFTINVLDSPTITSANVASFPTFTSSTFMVTASDVPSPTITESGTLPPGLTFTGGTGTATLSGQPTGPGSFPVTITANNGTFKTVQTLDVVAGFEITTTSLPPATRGASYQGQVTAIGGTQPYKWKATGLPKGLKISKSTGLIAGSPKSKHVSAGTFTVTLTVTDHKVKTSPKHPNPEGHAAETATAQITLTLN